TKEAIEPKQESTLEASPPEPAKEPVEEPKKEEALVPPEKPTSPLDALTREEKKEIVSDPFDEFDKIKKPTSDNWKSARDAMRTQKTRIETLESELATAKTHPSVAPEEFTNLRDENTRYKEIIARQENSLKAFNAEASEEFQALLRDREKEI